jgi:hypothetical protein
VADWLLEDHLAWFVIDVVAELDMSCSSLPTGSMVVVGPRTTRR